MNKLTKQNIEDLANEIMQFLKENDIDEDVLIYFNNKRMKHQYDYKNPDAEPKLIIEEDMCPLDYFDYVNRQHILSMSFEGGLYHILNYSFGQKEREFTAIFEKYGLYFELGNSWNLSAYPTNDDMEIEFTPYSVPKESVRLYHICSSNPEELNNIMKIWYDLSAQEGDNGSSVLGAGFNFEWNGAQYFMSAQSPYQGSLSWEKHKEAIKILLEDIGATNIQYDWGRMD